MYLRHHVRPIGFFWFIKAIPRPKWLPRGAPEQELSWRCHRVQCCIAVIDGCWKIPVLFDLSICLDIWEKMGRLYVIELDDGKIYRKALYLMVKTMVSCRFSLKLIHWIWGHASISCWWNGPGQIRLTGWIHLIKAWSAGEKKTRLPAIRMS